MDKKFIIYKTTCLINNKIYIGQHSTTNINDSYLGSGTQLNIDINKFGKDNFKKEILFEFDNFEDMDKMETEIVNRDFVLREDTYNTCTGGQGLKYYKKVIDSVFVRDLDGNCFWVNKEDPRYTSGELVGITKGFVNVRDSTGNYFQVSTDDSRYISGELVAPAHNRVVVKDQDGNTLFVNKEDPRYISGELTFIHTGKVLVKNKNEYFLIDKNDPRYISGELKSFWTGRRHTKESKAKIGKANSIKQKGKRNSQYGTTFIHNLQLKKCKRVKKEDVGIWISKGWVKGAKFKWD